MSLYTRGVPVQNSKRYLTEVRYHKVSTKQQNVFQEYFFFAFLFNFVSWNQTLMLKMFGKHDWEKNFMNKFLFYSQACICKSLQ